MTKAEGESRGSRGTRKSGFDRPPNSAIDSHITERSIADLEADIRDLESQLDTDFLKELVLCNEFPRIGKYELQRTLSHQAKSRVFLAFDRDLNRQVVIKFYPHDLAEKNGSKIIAEGRALAQIDSPYVAKCYGIEEFNGYYVLVMEFVRGRTLVEICNKENLPPYKCVEIVAKLAEGVMEIHNQEFLHRDLKPGNVVVNRHWTPKIIDLGLVESVNRLNVNEQVGTAAFLPPERARNRPEEIGVHSDVFGLGGILYFMLTGRAPFEAATREESLALAANGDVPLPHGFNPSVPSAVKKLCMRCLDPNVAVRYQDCIELGTAIQKTQSNRARLRWLLAAAAAVSIISLCIALLYIAFTTEATTPNHIVQRNDFEIETSFQLSGFDPNNAEVGISRSTRRLEEDKVTKLTTDSRLTILVKPMEDCFLAVLSFEPTSKSGRKYAVFPLLPSATGANAVKAKKNEVIQIPIEQIIVSKATEFVFVAASTQPWNTVDFEKIFAAELDDQFVRQRAKPKWRGLRSNQEKISVYRFPYLVDR